MDIVNQSLPRGSKFYPVEEYLTVPLSSLLNRHNIKILREAYTIVSEASANSEYWRMCQNTHNWEVAEGSDEYPIISMAKYSLGQIAYQFSTYTDNKKANYLSGERLGTIGTSATKSIKVQYDPVKKGIWLHDVEYEGELVNNKPMVVNRNLKSAVYTKIGELALEALIGAGDDDLEISHDLRYVSTASKASVVSELVIKVLSGDYDTNELASCAYGLGMYNCKWNGGKHVLDLDRPRPSGTFDITASARTKLIYHFGGYNLPDNYQEWFDGPTEE